MDLTVTVRRVWSVWVLLYLNTSDVQYGWHRLHVHSVRLQVWQHQYVIWTKVQPILAILSR